MRHLIVAMACALSSAAHGGAADVAAAWNVLQAAAPTQCQRDSDCRSLGVGVLACGGPQQFLSWSAPATDEPRLQAAARRFERARQKQIEKTGELSVCVVLEDPGASCQRAPDAAAGHCVLRQHGAQGQLR